MLLRWFPIVALLLSLLLSACGQKGALYLPDEPLTRTSHTHNSSASASAEAAVDAEGGGEGGADAPQSSQAEAEVDPEPDEQLESQPTVEQEANPQ